MIQWKLNYFWSTIKAIYEFSLFILGHSFGFKEAGEVPSMRIFLGSALVALFIFFDWFEMHRISIVLIEIGIEW